MASNSIFVRQLYQTVLARDPDASISSWTNVLDTGFFSRAQVVYEFLRSPEYEAGVETVGRLYYAVNKQALDLASYPLPWLSEDCPVYMSWHKSSGQDTGLNWLKDQVRAVSSF